MEENQQFVIEVKFRKNATWQGTVRHISTPEPANFRSMLELLKLMESAMDPSEAPALTK